MTVRKGDKRYHIGVGKGDVGNHIVLSGDIDRAREVSKRFDSIDLKVSNREFATYTGTLRGVRVSAMSTGIGPDNTEIALVELNGILPKGGVIVRCGSSGSLQKNARIGHIAVSTGAARLDKHHLALRDQGVPRSA